MRKHLKSCLAVILIAPVLAVGAEKANSEKSISELKDDSVLVVTGNIKSIRDDEFDLQYGASDKTITVELDRFNWNGDETQFLSEGESVTVSGVLDDDLFEGREIKAYNIRMNDSYVYYYTTEANPVYTYESTQNLPSDGILVAARGKITKINGPEVTIKSKTGEIIVDTADLNYDPFDDEGRQKLEIGDELYVQGQVDVEPWDPKEIVADSIVEFSAGAV